MEWIFIALIAFVLLFGSKKVPELAKSLGKAMGELQRGRMEIEREIQEATEPVREISKEISNVQNEISNVKNEVQNASKQITSPLKISQLATESRTSEPQQGQDLPTQTIPSNDKSYVDIDQTSNRSVTKHDTLSSERIKIQMAAKSLGIETAGKTTENLRDEIKKAVESTQINTPEVQLPPPKTRAARIASPKRTNRKNKLSTRKTPK